MPGATSVVDPCPLQGSSFSRQNVRYGSTLTFPDAALTRRLRGHFNYFGVSGNFRSLQLLVAETKKAWLKWLRRRSHRTRLNSERFTALLVRFPLPRPRITVRIWGS